MNSYTLTRLAKSDVFQTWSYIARDSVGAADRVEQAIYDPCASLARDPLLGHARPDFTDRTLRFWSLVRYPNYTGVYRPENGLFRLSLFFTGKEISVAC